MLHFIPLLKHHVYQCTYGQFLTYTHINLFRFPAFAQLSIASDCDSQFMSQDSTTPFLCEFVLDIRGESEELRTYLDANLTSD